MDQAALQIDSLATPLRLKPLPALRETYVASTERRIQAFLIDEFLRILAFVPWVVALGGKFPTAETFRLSWGWMVLCYSFHFGARVMCLRYAGGTPGKLLMGLRLVGRDRDALEWSQALLRTLTDDLATAMGLATKMLAFIRFDRTHLSDWIAETRVVQLKPRARIPHRRMVMALTLFLLLAYEGLQHSVYWLETYGVPFERSE